MNNAQYHADLTRLSSSSLKVLLKNPTQFHHEYVLGHREEVYKPAFAEGSYTHTLCLEPEKLADYAIWTGLRRAGHAYEAFKAANPGKVILSSIQKTHSESYFRAYQARAEAVRMLSGGAAEYTMQAELLGVPVKARADYINIEAGYIADVKTTALPSGLELFAGTVSQYDYDLSAALYCLVAEKIFGRKFDFYWVVISKCDMDCQIYKMGEATMAQGTGKVWEALALYNRCKETGIWSLNQPKRSFETVAYEIEVV